MDLLQFLQAISADSTHLVMIVFMVMTYTRQKARQKALEGHLQRLERYITALHKQMRQEGLIQPFSDDNDM